MAARRGRSPGDPIYAVPGPVRLECAPSNPCRCMPALVLLGGDPCGPRLYNLKADIAVELKDIARSPPPPSSPSSPSFLHHLIHILCVLLLLLLPIIVISSSRSRSRTTSILFTLFSCVFLLRTEFARTYEQTGPENPPPETQLEEEQQGSGGGSQNEQQGRQQEQAAERRRSSGKGYALLTGFPFPLGPMFQRDTVLREVDPGSIWVLEQTQALEPVGVYTPVRMTVIKLASGGLWVHGPLAPTEECVGLLRGLGCPVEYIILPTFAYEHKAFLAPFARRFPGAQVFVTPYLWSFPVNLPNRLLGINAKELSPTEEGMPWAAEIGQRLLLPPSVSVADYARQGECAFFHRRSRTLLVTDSLAFVDDEVPEVIPRQALLDMARDSWLNRGRPGDLSPAEVAEIADDTPQADTQEARLRGYQRMSLICLYFDPSNLLRPDASWAAISGRLICPPVVETLIYGNVKRAVAAWADSMVGAWPDIARVIPAHYTAPARASAEDVRRAFAFAYSDTAQEDEEGSINIASEGGAVPGQAEAAGGPAASPSSPLFEGKGRGARLRPERAVDFPEADVRTLRWLNNTLQKYGFIKKAPE